MLINSASAGISSGSGLMPVEATKIAISGHSWAQRRAGSNPVILPLSRPENDADKLAHKGGIREFGFYIDKQKNRNILLLDRQAVSMLTA